MITHWIFIANSVHCFLKSKVLYGLAFLLLTVTSSVVWSDFEYNFIKYWIDQFAIYSVILIGWVYSTKIKDSRLFYTAVASIIVVGLIHVVGLVFDTYEYHHLVHVISSFGHHVILLGN
jgi:hypothetical protein